jgi:hypothetical protein
MDLVKMCDVQLVSNRNVAGVGGVEVLEELSGVDDVLEAGFGVSIGSVGIG